nr:MAG TPA: hypothetical protein [Caudoviricetes sp.]
MPRANTLVAALKIKLLVFALKEVSKNGSQMGELVGNTKRKIINNQSRLGLTTLPGTQKKQ